MISLRVFLVNFLPEMLFGLYLETEGGGPWYILYLLDKNMCILYFGSSHIHSLAATAY